MSPADRPRLSQTERSRLADVAERYWVEGLKVEAIGREMGISRSTVSRMLARARAEHVIEFIVHRDEDSAAALRQAIQVRYGIQASVPPVDEDAPYAVRRLAVGDDAAVWLGALVQPHSVITVAWGTTVEAMSARLRRRPVPGVQIVQLHGSGNVSHLGQNYAGEILGRFGAALDADVHLLQVPAVFDTAASRATMWAERSVKQVLDLRDQADVLVTSVGSPDGDASSLLYHSGYLSAQDMAELEAQGAVGNIGSVFFRADGSSEGIELNERTTGPSFERIRQIRQRILVVADAHKAVALDAAIRAGLATHVVLDPATARALLAV